MRRKEERIDDYSIEEKSEFAEDKEMDQELVSFWVEGVFSNLYKEEFIKNIAVEKIGILLLKSRIKER